MSTPCFLYIFGYPHAQFGHVVKVGISSDVQKRLATIQSHNPDKVEVHFAFQLQSREIARHIEKSFHDRFSHVGIRGEWFGLPWEKALFMVTQEIVGALRQIYPAEHLSRARASSGLLEAFKIIDAIGDEHATEWNAELEEVFFS